MPIKASCRVAFWSRGGQTPLDNALRRPVRLSKQDFLPFATEARWYTGKLAVPTSGTLVLQITSPRPIRIWADGRLVADESLHWTLFQREVRFAAVLPVVKGLVEFKVEVGDRPRHPDLIDRICPSRNRKAVLSEVARIRPDGLSLQANVFAQVEVPAVGLRFEPSQFIQDQVVYQHLLVRPLPLFNQRPSTALTVDQVPVEPLAIHSSILPNVVKENTSDEDRSAGLRRFWVPVAEPQDHPRALRAIGKDKRPEPILEIARYIELTMEGSRASIRLKMPAYETLGRLAPFREYRTLVWPTIEKLKAGVPEPVLPEKHARFGKLYYAAWEMFLELLRDPPAQNGGINSYVATGAAFGLKQFVWDSSFTAICMAYGWRVMDACANLNNLYSRQFDGGYIHRQHHWTDGLPHLFEPDFSPNPPIMSLAEWHIASLTGDKLRLRKVYPALKGYHQWLYHNRRLKDGTYWTTGLANGLDNSPSLGEGYPCLSAQMAQEAEILGHMARLLNLQDDAADWDREYLQLAQAINARLWNESVRIYSSSLPGRKHNPNKVVTAFWPLWAGVVPPDRVQALAAHLLDPASFWRHHPIPSLAADSPYYNPLGDYWLGSTWAPTNYAAIKGFDRAGRHDLAVETTLRHLQRMLEVYQETGAIWENYSAEESKPGSMSGKPYCWSALGPIALLLEVVIGLQPDALNRRLTWSPPAGENAGVRNYPLGEATLSLIQRQHKGKEEIVVETDRTITLQLLRGGKMRQHVCRPGRTTL